MGPVHAVHLIDYVLTLKNTNRLASVNDAPAGHVCTHSYESMSPSFG